MRRVIKYTQKHREVLKSNLATCLERLVYKARVFTAMMYVVCTWKLPHINDILSAKSEMKRSVLNVTYRDRKTAGG